MTLDPGTQGVIISLVLGAATSVIVLVLFDLLLRSKLPTVFQYRKYLQYVSLGDTGSCGNCCNVGSCAWSRWSRCGEECGVV